MAFKMKGSPLHRNFGIGQSPAKQKLDVEKKEPPKTTVPKKDVVSEEKTTKLKDALKPTIKSSRIGEGGPKEPYKKDPGTGLEMKSPAKDIKWVGFPPEHDPDSKPKEAHNRKHEMDPEWDHDSKKKGEKKESSPAKIGIKDPSTWYKIRDTKKDTKKKISKAVSDTNLKTKLAADAALSGKSARSKKAAPTKMKSPAKYMGDYVVSGKGGTITQIPEGMTDEELDEKFPNRSNIIKTGKSAMTDWKKENPDAYYPEIVEQRNRFRKGLIDTDKMGDVGYDADQEEINELWKMDKQIQNKINTGEELTKEEKKWKKHNDRKLLKLDRETQNQRNERIKRKRIREMEDSE